MGRSAVERLPQRLTALGRANEIRLRRADVGRGVRLAPSRPESAARAIEVLREREDAVQTLAVADLLRWVKGVGETAARRACLRLRVPETKPIGALTDRQVGLVEDWLRARGHLT